MSLSEHARLNRERWDAESDEYQERHREFIGRPEPRWGTWQLPESELRIIGDVAGKDVLELGCGTAYFSFWLARRDARLVGVDITAAQLETARRMQERFGLEFDLIEASAENVPLPDASFDLAVSEYGASIWADPYRWIPEAARLLRPGGELVFLVNGTIYMLCAAEDETAPGTRFLRPYFGMHRFEWPDNASVDFHLGYGDWIRLLGENGLEVEALVELRAPEGAKQHRYAEVPTPEWARRWPSEEIWKARKA